jgi:uncharacterized membrane protein
MDSNIERYFEALKHELRDLPSPRMEEIVRELRSHVRDRLAEGESTPDAAQRVLEALGRPEEIAGEYRVELLLSQARETTRPWVLLAGTMGWAKHRLRGAVVFVFISLCYLTAVVLLACAVMKPVLPGNVGLWLGTSQLVVGSVDTTPARPRVVGLVLGFSPPSLIVGRPGQIAAPYREVLGFWLVPLALAAAIALFYFSTQVARRSIARGANLVAERLARG